MALTDTQLRAFKPAATPKKLSDGGGLHVLVKPQGSKLWRLAYRFGGKQKLLALGSYPVVSLAEARTARERAKVLLASGVDRSEQAKLDKIATQTANAITFDIIADEFLAKVKREGKAEATLAKKEWLVGLARPDIGRRPIRDITAAEVLAPLRRVEAAGNYETARRLRAVVGQVFRYAIATARADNDPTFGLRGALVSPTVSHRAAITDWSAFAGLLRAIWGYKGTVETRAALKLIAILYPRPGELRQAEWSEFDLDKAIWTVPAARTKMRREHRKPLPAEVLAVLRELQNHTGNRRLAFPSIQSPERPLERRASDWTHKGRSILLNRRIVLSENRFRFSGRCFKRKHAQCGAAASRLRTIRNDITWVSGDSFDVPQRKRQVIARCDRGRAWPCWGRRGSPSLSPCGLLGRTCADGGVVGIRNPHPVCKSLRRPTETRLERTL